jgi:hypothetical protein
VTSKNNEPLSENLPDNTNRMDVLCDDSEGHSLLHPLPPGVNFTPKDELGHQGCNLSHKEECSPLRSPPGVNTPNYLEEWRGEQRIYPPRGYLHPHPGDKIHPWKTTLPLGSKFAPRGENKNGPQKTCPLFALFPSK